MIAPWIIEDGERRRSERQQQPLYIEAPRPLPYLPEPESEREPEPRRVIIIDYNTGEES